MNDQTYKDASLYWLENSGYWWKRLGDGYYQVEGPGLGRRVHRDQLRDLVEELSQRRRLP